MRPTIKLSTIFLILALSTFACTFGQEISGGDSGEILFKDDFSDESSGWDIYSDEDGTTEYFSGVYRITVNTNTMFYWANPYEMFEDVIIEVQAGKSSGGDDMQYGVICRYVDHENWYAMIITADGYAGIRKRYQGGGLDFITELTKASSVNIGNESNLLRAECIGSRLSLYVNNELAVEVYDSDIRSGDVGLMAGTFDQPSTEAIFDNILVRQP